jgi:hypothetical protein
MPRGFAGETSAQEARGNENISEAQVDRGRDEADMRSEARDFRSSASPINNVRPSIDALVNSFTAKYGPLSRGAFNSVYGRNIQNPGGIDTLGYGTANVLGKLAPNIFRGGVKSTVPQLSGTVFSKKAPGGGTLVKSGGKMMGMSAEDYYSGKSGAGVGRSDLETYQDKYGYATPQERELNRAYDQYMNPYNEPGKVGYNPDAPTMNPVTDQVRPGLRSGIFTDMSGRPTVQGPLRTMDTAYSAQDRAVMSLAGLTLGGLMQQLTGKKTVIGNVPSMDAMLPTPEMIEQGQTYGGLSRQIGAGIGDVFQGIQSYFSPEPQNRPPAPQYTEAQLNENMYGVGMPDLGVSSYGAPVPEANIQLNRSAGPITTEDVVRDIDTVLDKLNTGALGELRNSATSASSPPVGSVFEVDGRSFLVGKNGPIELSGVAEQDAVSSNPLMESVGPETKIMSPQDYFANETGQLANPASKDIDGRTMGLDEGLYGKRPEVLSGIQLASDTNFDGTYDRSFFNDVLGIMGLTETPTVDFQPQILQRTPSGEFIEIQPRERKEIQGPQSSRSLPNVMTLAEGKTYRSGYQGQSGLYSAGGKGQTYYGGGNQQNKNFLGTAAERARQAFDNLYGYFTG